MSLINFKEVVMCMVCALQLVGFLLGKY